MEVVHVELMSIGKFAKQVGVNTSTMRKMDQEGWLKRCRVAGQRSKKTKRRMDEVKSHVDSGKD